MSDQVDQDPSDTKTTDEINEMTIARLNTLTEIRNGTSSLSEEEQKEFYQAWIADTLNAMLIQKRLSESS